MSISLHSAGGRSVATAATVNHAAAQLWNPHATKRIRVMEIAIFCVAAPAAGAGLHLLRSSARGTPGSTVTPVQSNDHNTDAVPQSGALLDLAVFTGQPTLAATVSLYRYLPPAVIASGIVIPFPMGIIIPAGQGLVLANSAGVIFPSIDVTFVWDE